MRKKKTSTETSTEATSSVLVKPLTMEEVRILSRNLFAEIRRQIWEAPPLPSVEEKMAVNAQAFEQLRKDIEKQEAFRLKHGYYPWDKKAIIREAKNVKKAKKSKKPSVKKTRRPKAEA